MENNRRDFLKKLGTLSAGLGLMAAAPLDAVSKIAKHGKKKKSTQQNDKPFTVSILQTTDVHCQVHPHDELFLGK
jgi:sulfur-oxidizing protein SoxB